MLATRSHEQSARTSRGFVLPGYGQVDTFAKRVCVAERTQISLPWNTTEVVAN